MSSHSSQKIFIYGKHSVIEALSSAPHVVEKLYISNVADEALDVQTKTIIRSAVANNGVQKNLLNLDKLGTELSQFVKKEELEELAHQGMVAIISLKSLLKDYKKFIEDLADVSGDKPGITPNTCIAILGELDDIQNIGAVIRSAAAFGISAVLIPEHNQAPITATAIKVSVGMAFKVPLISISNINTTVRDLQARGFWVYGLDETAKHTLDKEKFDAPTVFILGNEAEGIRTKTRELCDKLLSIQMDADCESLNASASAAVAFYTWSIQHKGAMKNGKRI